MEHKLLTALMVAVVMIGAATVGAEYVRPKPRKALHFPWSRKPSSEPQQVKKKATLFFFLWFRATFLLSPVLCSVWLYRNSVEN